MGSCWPEALLFQSWGSLLVLFGFPFQVQIFVGDTETYALKASLASPFETSPSFKNAKQEARDKYGTEYVFLTGRLGRIQKMYCDAALGNAKVMQAAKNTDLIVGDAFYICGSLIAAKFSLPFVTVFAMSLSTFTAHGYGLPLTPSYVPQFQSILGDHLSFIGRIQNVYHWILNYWTHYYKIVPFFQDLKVRYKIEPNKSLHEILNRVDLIIAQMGFFLDYPRPLLPSRYVVHTTQHCLLESIVKTIRRGPRANSCSWEYLYLNVCK